MSPEGLSLIFRSGDEDSINIPSVCDFIDAVCSRAYGISHFKSPRNDNIIVVRLSIAANLIDIRTCPALSGTLCPWVRPQGVMLPANPYASKGWNSIAPTFLIHLIFKRHPELFSCKIVCIITIEVSVSHSRRFRGEIQSHHSTDPSRYRFEPYQRVCKCPQRWMNKSTN
jgi:hypothetical protein